MGQIGAPELIMIFIIALLVFGPKKLPELGKSLGKGLKEFRRATDDLKSTWEEQMREVEKHVDDVKTTVNEATKDIKTDLTADFHSTYPSQPAVTEVTPEPVTDIEEPKNEVHQA